MKEGLLRKPCEVCRGRKRQKTTEYLVLNGPLNQFVGNIVLCDSCALPFFIAQSEMKLRKLMQHDVEQDIEARPHDFAWLGKSQRRWKDFADGYFWAMTKVKEVFAEDFAVKEKKKDA